MKPVSTKEFSDAQVEVFVIDTADIITSSPVGDDIEDVILPDTDL